jgi:hypothetical protein
MPAVFFCLNCVNIVGLGGSSPLEGDNMNRRKLFWAGSIAAGLVALYFLYGVFGTHTVVINEEQVQGFADKIVGKEFPIKGSKGFVVKSATVKKTSVRIQDGKISAEILVEGLMLTKKKFILTSYTTGMINYENGKFFYKPEKVEMRDFSYANGSLSDSVGAFADKYVESEKRRALIKDSAPNMERWITTIAETAVATTLQNRPIYQVKDDLKGVLIKSSISSVTVNGSQIQVVLSLWQLTISVGIGIIILLASVAMVWVLMQNPALGLLVVATSSI